MSVRLLKSQRQLQRIMNGLTNACLRVRACTKRILDSEHTQHTPTKSILILHKTIIFVVKKSTTMTIINKLGPLLGALLLLTMVLESSAFTTNTPLPSPLNVRQNMRRFSSIADQDSSTLPDHMASSLQQREPSDIMLGNIMGATDEVKTASRLPWLFMVVALLQTQLFKSGNVGAETFALSTVSTTLLRSSRGARWFSAQQLLAVGVLSWQVLSNIGNVVSWMQMTGSALSVWYMGCLATSPIYTKSLTSALIGFTGDTAAQFIEERLRARKEGTPSQFRGRYDRRRGLANVSYGIFVTGPLLHFAYNFLETLIPVSGAATGLAASLAALCQVLIDDFIFDGLFVGLMFVTTGLGEGYKMRDIAKQFRKDYVGAVKTSWSTSVLLMPLEFVLFRFFPLNVRVLGMNMIDIVWEGMMSYLVHKRRRGAISQKKEVHGVHNLRTMEQVAVPAH